MNQPCERKCDCKQYNETDHRAALLSMELPDLEYPSNNGTAYVVYRTIRFVGYVVLLSLLAYSLWRIRTIETQLSMHEREANISRILAMSSSNLHQQQHHQRSTRSAKDQLLLNSFGDGKQLPPGALPSSKNENVMPKMKKIRSKEDFQQMVSTLFDKIHKMHDDHDRANFDSNMKEVFQAWFPVFEALLPHEYFVNEEEGVRSKRSVAVNRESLEEMDVNALGRKKSSEESSEEKSKGRQRRSPSVDESKSSSEEQKPKPVRIVRSVDESKSSSKEQKPKPTRFVRSVDESKSSSEEKKPKPTRSVRSANKSSDESKSSDSTEENLNKYLMDKRYKNKINAYKKKQKSIEESSDSSMSNEKRENRERLNLVYQTVTEVDGAERRIIVTSE